MLKHSYIVLGLGGVLGKAFFNQILEMTEEYRIFGFDHGRVDVTNPDHVAGVISYIKPTVVVNCASVSDLDMCEQAQEGARLVNAVGPGVIAAECKKNGCRLVHLSSSMVFDGKRKTPYGEKSACKSANALGVTKAAGEEAVRDNTDDFLIVRMGWLFGEVGDTELARWFLNADDGAPVDVAADHSVSPVYAADLAEAVMGLAVSDKKEARGVFHVSNSGYVKVGEIARAAFDICGSHADIREQDMHLPKNLHLSTAKYDAVSGKPLRPWEDALKECLYKMNRYRP